MDKEQVAAVLDEIGTLLEIQGENAFRCNAYHNAARAIEQLEVPVEQAVNDGTLTNVRGIGDTLRDKITTLVTTGRLPFYEDLKKKTPAGLFQMLRIQGMGPKKVKALYDQLGIDDIDKLKAACEAGQVAKLKGFGAKTQQKILEGIEFVSQTGQRVRLDQALTLAEGVAEKLRECPGIIRMELCGSLRRRKETIKDIDILISSDDPGPIMERFVGLPEVVQVTGHGDTKSSVVLGRTTRTGRRQLINADLRIVTDEQFPLALHHFSGSKEHNVTMRTRAQARYGIKLNEYEMLGPKGPIPVKDEPAFFRALGLDYIPPEMREDTGEVEAAEKHQLPDLIELDDLKGTFHCHTTWSDGSNTLEEMAEAARALGLKYLGIGDHSQSLTVANGLTPDRVRRQQEQIDRLNERLTGIRVFKGTECDILPDGSLDFDDDLLATFDYVVASVHSRFGQSEEEMTERIVRAVSNPHVTMLGHATGRLLLSRDAYRVDLEAVLRAAAKHGTMVEINAQPSRLDIDWVHCKRAKALGVQLVINPDAHSTGELGLLRYGVDVARRGWLEKKDVLNTKTPAQVTRALQATRDRAPG
jgi:DNA polymerase (family 10)